MNITNKVPSVHEDPISIKGRTCQLVRNLWYGLSYILYFLIYTYAICTYFVLSDQHSKATRILSLHLIFKQVDYENYLNVSFPRSILNTQTKLLH